MEVMDGRCVLLGLGGRTGCSERPVKVVVARTGLDGHWRGVMLVASALRDAGFDVILLGAATGDEIAAAVRDEDPDLLGLNMGGHVSVAERIIGQVRELAPQLPIIAGGTIPPWAADRLEALGVRSFPPGSRLDDIVETARDLTGLARKAEA